MAVISCLLVLAMLTDGVLSVTHTVTFTDTPIWTVGIGVAYSDLTINLGETLAFTSYAEHDVVLVHAPDSGTAWDQCSMVGIQGGSFTTIWALSDFSTDVANEQHYTPPSCGDFYMACSISAHCLYGQRFKVTVNSGDGSACTTPCVGAACVNADAKRVVTSGTVHHVKPDPDSQYWGSTTSYDALTVNVGDSVLFRTGAGYHDVATVPTLAALSSCDMTGKTLVADWDFSSGLTSAACNSSATCCAGSSCGSSGSVVTYTFTAEAAGDTYFICSMGTHCQTGQKFVLTVKNRGVASMTCRPDAYQCLAILVFAALMR